jgi:hypothetical protein
LVLILFNNFAEAGFGNPVNDHRYFGWRCLSHWRYESGAVHRNILNLQVLRLCKSTVFWRWLTALSFLNDVKRDPVLIKFLWLQRNDDRILNTFINKAFSWVTRQLYYSVLSSCFL